LGYYCPSMLASAFVVSFFSLLSRIMGLFRDRLLAGEIGAGDVLDTYYAAFRVPDLVFNTFILGAVGSAFIPVFLGSYAKNKERAWELAVTLLNYITLIAIFFACIAYIFAPYIVSLTAPGFNSMKQAETVLLTRIMLAGTVFLGISNVLSGIQNAFKRFLASSIAPVLYNAGIIFGIVVLWPRYGAAGLAYGVVIGACFHLLIQVPSLVREGFSWRPQFNITSDIKEVLTLMVPRTIALTATQINEMVNTVIGSTLRAGSVAIYNLAYNLQIFPIGLIGIPFALTAFPAFAQASAENDKKKFSDAFSLTFRRILFFVVPASIFLLLLRAHVVRLVLGTGVFDWTQTILTARTLGFFSLSIFAQALIPLLSRAFYALKDTRTPLLVSLIYLAINIGISWKLASVLGIAGLALSFSLVTIAQCLTLWFALRMKVGDLHDDLIWESTLKISLASIVSGLCMYAMLFFVARYVDTHTYVGLLTQAGISSFVGGCVYVALVYSWGKREILYEK